MGNKRVLYPNLVAELSRNGITVTRLADNLSISRAALYKKLSGNTDFTLKDITTIQEVIKASNSSGDYTLEYLFYRADKTA